MTITDLKILLLELNFISGTEGAGWDAKRWWGVGGGKRHAAGGPGTGLPSNAGTAEFGSCGRAQSNSLLPAAEQQS